MSAPSPVSLASLAGLARAVAFDARLEVVAGEEGGGWSLEATTGRIRCDPEDLRSAHPDDVRSLVCHEAAHWAVTRYPALVPRAVLAEPGVAPLLNALEDCRIETWLGRRFPGTAVWIRRTNDRLLPVSVDELPRQPLAHQFCLGAIVAWWEEAKGQSMDWPVGMDPRVVDALEATRVARREAVALQPPVSVLEAEPLGYAGSGVARRFAALDQRHPPDPFERAVRGVAWDWWQLVHRHVRPAYQALVEADRRERSASDQEEERFVRRLRGLAPGAYGAAGAQRSASPGRGTSRGGSRPRPLSADSPDSYERARRQVAPLVERTCEALLPLVTRGQLPRWGGAHPSGGRVDLRRVMQAEADPRQRDNLWLRKSLPVRHDPVVHLLLDLSGSMAGERIEQAFAGVVLLLEVLHRLGIPCAVSGFQDVRIPVLDPRDPLDAASRARVGRLPLEVVGGRSDGRNRPEHNHDGPVLLEAVGTLLEHPASERWLWVLSDGLPTGPGDGVGALRRAIERVAADGRVQLVGIGLGPGTDHVGAFYPEALPAVPLTDLPEALGGLLARRVVGAL